ncbi:MAG: glycoside hydrolase family 2 protein [Lachnospiraceae bacterium]|nr:glycoside hydrolase family 2 protein [Lachnospiraceae bacterium]
MREIINFNFKWAFTKNASEIPNTMPKKWDFVNLPHSWNNIDGQDGGNDYYRGTCYYAKELKRQELPQADQYYLELQGANSSAEVYVNGKKLAQHDGGYSIWRVNMTEAIQDENLIVIAVDNSENDHVYPQMADFTFYGGLYRDVNIIAVNKSHFDLDYYGAPGIKVTPKINGSDASVEVEVFLTGAGERQELVYTVRDREGRVAAENRVSAAETKAVLSIPDVHLWHGRKDPYLYTAEVSLRAGSEELDRVSTRFGCRTFIIDPEKGFILNGESYPLRGVSRHQDRWGFGNALLPEHHREDMDLICEMGATTIRLAHYQHDQYFYDLCDERGMVVWAEIPYISKHMPGGRENTVSQMKELIMQNYNHPSIVVWGLSNEITMSGASDEDLLENHRILNDLAHELDPTRQTVIACVSMCDIHDPYVQIPDAVSYNHYFGWYGGDTSMNGPWLDNFHAEFPKIPIGVSEYGCEALNWHTSNPAQGDYTEEYQAHYHEELIKQLYTRPYLWATHVWNMFDFGADARNEGGENGQNHKGLVTFDRKYKKDSFYAYKAWLSDQPFVHICGKRYVDRVEEITKVTVYSNLPSVELFVNGESLGKQESKEHFFYFDVQNRGEARLVAAAGECRDESVIRKVDTFNEAYRLKEKGAVLNWFDITAPEGYFSLNDKMSDIMESEEGRKVLDGFLSPMMKGGDDGKMAGFEMNENMVKMMSGFTLIRLTNLMGTAGVTFTKEQLLELNAKLNRVEK